MAFTTPPTPPSSGSPVTFNDDADEFFGWFPTFVSELNTVGYPSIPTLAAPGSAAAPAFSYALDPDTGMYRVGANILGFATGGTERVRITSAGMQLTGLLSGTAVTQSDTDTTAGRLLKVGDFGLGTLAPTTLANLDATPVASGTWSWYASSGTGTPPNTNGYFSISVYGRNGTAPGVYMVARSMNPQSIWIRRWTGDSWEAWVLVYTQSTILGTVSQSGGVPTGALIQTGSTSAGRFRRDASGEMTCRGKVTSSTSAAATWTYPSAFAEEPVVTATPITTTPCTVIIEAAPGTSSVTFSVYNLSGTRISVPVELRAEGRWSTMS